MESYLNTLRITRKLAFLFLCFILTLGRTHAAGVGEDGLHKQDWFALTFKDIAEDVQEAADEGKRLVLVFEQPGAPIALKPMRRCCPTLK